MIQPRFDVQSNLSEMLPRKTNAVVAAVEAALNAQIEAERDVIVDDKLAGGVLQRRTGQLANSVRAIEAAITGESVFTGSIEAAGGDAYYGFFQEHGTDRRYPIEPKNAQALAFLAGGRRVVVKRVDHPPIQQRSFMQSTHDERRSGYAEALFQAVQEALNR